MAQFTHYQSTDIGAPQLYGASGSLTGVLTACLVNGYGSKSAAGWSLEYSTTTGQAVYRMGSGVRFYLQVDDSGPGPGTTKEARIAGYESMSSVFVGSNPFPTSAQGVTGLPMLPIRKSSTADFINSRYWQIYADNRTFYMFVQTVDVTGVYAAFGFGEIYSLAGSGDTSRCVIIGRNAENNGTAAAEQLDVLCKMNTTCPAHFAARTYTNAGTSVAFGKHGDGVKGYVNGLSGQLAFPNGLNNAAYASPVWVTETSSMCRGFMRGFFHFLHPTSFVTDGQNIGTGIGGPLVGKNFAIVKTSAHGGAYLIETSNTLDTN